MNNKSSTGTFHFSNVQKRELGALLKKKWDPDTRILGKPVTLENIVERLEGVVDGIRRGRFDPGSSPGIERARSVYAQLDRFLVACGKLQKVYDSLDDDARRAIDWFATGEQSDKTFRNQLLTLCQKIEEGPRLRKRSRGAPVDFRRVMIAQAVGWVLITSGVRLTKSREGKFARVLAIVLDAAKLPVPQEMFPLIRAVVPGIEHEAYLGG